jgi:hypothetical protein
MAEFKITQGDVNTCNSNADFYEAAALRAEANGNFERAVEFRRDAEKHRKWARDFERSMSRR